MSTPLDSMATLDAPTLIASVLLDTEGARLPAAPSDSAMEPAQAVVAWPEIEGIDTQGARSRWCDDLKLFRSMLELFLGDFADIASPSLQSEESSLAERAIRLHKLRGGACMLGARAIQHLAAEAEAACKAGDGARAQERSIELITHLEALRLSAAGNKDLQHAKPHVLDR